MEYFHNNNQEAGLQYLKVAAEGSYTEGLYIYGIILCCRGLMEEGTAYLDRLGWRESKARGDRTWKKIKRALHGMRVRHLPVYTETLGEMRPTIMCNTDDLLNRCGHCYYYKQMVKFVYVI